MKKFKFSKKMLLPSRNDHSCDSVNKISLYVFILYVVSISIIGQLFSKVDASNFKNKEICSSTQWLQFSSTQHDKERKLVMKYQNITDASFKHGKIYIALADLNNDGVKEIFAYIDIFEYCGQETGCPLNIYKIQDNKLISVLETEFSFGFPIGINININKNKKIVGVLKTTSNNWHDLCVKESIIWKWNGKHY